jgi:hypothetical protein
VVLKTILPDIVGEEDFVRMFLDEARTTAGFNHPHIAHVYELDTSEDVLFMAMEFVQGCTLVEMARACRQAREPIPIGMTLAAVRDTALALHYAHTFVDPRGRRQVVIHRDVAEKNIMVTYEGVTKLLDFGIAKALGKAGRTSAGMVKGTSGYMSPEQIRGEPLDGRSDLFSLGVVLHECLTGLRLFHGKNAEEGMLAALKGEVAPPSRWNALVPPEVDAVVLRALSRDRDARFGTALEMGRAIERAAPGALWHPEQSGEQVLRHFADRRAETRRVLEAAFGADGTSEVPVQSLIQKMKGVHERQAIDALPPFPPPLPATVKAGVATQPGMAPHPAFAPDDPITNPDRVRVGSAQARGAAPRSAPTARSINLTPDEGADDTASEAKTLTAAALPEEIQALQRRVADTELNRASPARPSQSGTVRAPPVVRSQSGETSSLTRRESVGSDRSGAFRPLAVTTPDGPRARLRTPSREELPTPSEPADLGARRDRVVWALVGVGGLVASLTFLWLLLGH